MGNKSCKRQDDSKCVNTREESVTTVTLSSNGDIRTESGEDKSNDSLLYRVDESPPWYTSSLFGFQQFLLCISLMVTFPLIVMTVMCADNSEAVTDYKTYMIGTVFVVSGISTFIQTTFGLRLPLIESLTAAYLSSQISIMSSPDLKCPAQLDLNPNSSHIDFSVELGQNSSKTIHDNLMNKTINVDDESNYYRDNDGIIRSSNELWLLRLHEIQGGIICASFLQLALGLTGAMGFLLRFIGPLTIAPTLVLLSYGIFETAQQMSSDQWGISLLVVALFFIFAICMEKVLVPIPNCEFKRNKLKITSKSKLPLFSMFPILLATLLGWFVCYVITIAGGFSDDPNDPSYNARTDGANAILRSPWIRFPYPFQFGFPIFTARSILGMMAAVLPGILESIGDYNATAVVCDEPSPPKHAVNRGVFMEGICILLSGLFGTGNATTTWSHNIVLLGVSKVASRRVFQVTGLIMFIFGLFTKFLSVFSSLPVVVLGGTVCATMGMILAIGVDTLKHVDMSKNRNLFIFGFSILFGVVLPMYAVKHGDRVDVGIEELNNIIRVLIRSPMFVGGIVGFALDNIAPGTREERGLVGFYASKSGTKSSGLVYQLPFKTDWKWTKWIPVCPNFLKPRTRI
uniref:solute carrier family 23 member 1-like n=1 Tax=Styela clava TaxID=7725 RepID=UPI00193AA0B1|nr:solute carrier family 23 member 1-like [Styela clava]